MHTASYLILLTLEGHIEERNAKQTVSYTIYVQCHRDNISGKEWSEQRTVVQCGVVHTIHRYTLHVALSWIIHYTVHLRPVNTNYTRTESLCTSRPSEHRYTQTTPSCRSEGVGRGVEEKREGERYRKKHYRVAVTNGGCYGHTGSRTHSIHSNATLRFHVWFPTGTLLHIITRYQLYCVTNSGM